MNQYRANDPFAPKEGAGGRPARPPRRPQVDPRRSGSRPERGTSPPARANAAGAPRRVPAPQGAQGQRPARPPQGQRPPTGPRAPRHAQRAMPARPNSPAPNERRRPERPPADQIPVEARRTASSKKQKKGKGSKSGGVPRWVLIGLDILIVAIIGLALFFFLKPKFDERNAENFKKQILEEMEKNKSAVQVDVPRNFGMVQGEENIGLEFINRGEGGASDTVSLTYVGRLGIPKIGVITPLASDVDDVSLRFGSGIYPEFAGINEPGLTTIFGHRFLTSGRDFNRLDEIVAGDTFYIDYMPTGERYHYKVYEQVIIPWEQLRGRVMEYYEDDTVVLITCHPPVYLAQDERILVYAKPELDKTEPIPD